MGPIGLIAVFPHRFYVVKGKVVFLSRVVPFIDVLDTGDVSQICL